MNKIVQNPPAFAAHAFAWRGLLVGRDDLAGSWRRLHRRRWLILALVSVITLAAAVVLLRMPHQYVATAKLLVDPRGARMLESASSLMPGLLVDREAVESEIQIMLSRQLAGRVVDKLGLIDDPDFNTELADDETALPGSAALAAARAWLTARLASRTVVDLNLNAEIVARAKVVDRFFRRLAIGREGQSRVISVAVSTRDPIRAAEIANTMCELYLVDHLETKLEQRRQVTRWLEERLGELRYAAAAAEKAAEEYRRQTGLFETRDGTGRRDRIDTQQLAQLSDQIIAARADRAALEAKLREAEAQRGTGGRGETVPEVISSPVIATLRAQEARALQRLADLEREYGAQHPRMIGAKAELADIRANIGREIRRILESLRDEVRRVRAREGALEASFRELEKKTGEQNSAQIRLNELTREAEANRNLLEDFLQQAKQISARQALAEPDARVIAYAEPPFLPAGPRKSLLLACVFLGALFLACAIALVLEHLSSGFRSSEQVEDATGLKVLAVVPALSRRSWLRQTPGVISRHALKRPSSSFAEALNSLRIALLTLDGRPAPKSILFTSSYPGEGKTTLAISFARLLARQGRKVILVDADVRRAHVAQALDLQPRAGLIEVLARDAALAEAIAQDPMSPLAVITAGRAKTKLQTIIDQQGLAQLVARLGQSYDCVVIDGAPILVVSDVRILARVVDASVFVARWSETAQADVRSGLKQLADAGARIAGVVLNAVDIRSYAGYEYRNARAYVRAYSRYYRA